MVDQNRHGKPPATGRYARISDDQWRTYFAHVEVHGSSKNRAAEVAGISWSTIMRIGREERAGTYDPRIARIRYAVRQANPEPPRQISALDDPAKRAVEDFEFFRRRYLGHVSMPWHIDAAEIVRQALETEHEEFVVINAPPGSGKSTLFTLDIPLWLIVRDRALRILIGSAAQNIAKMYTQQLRRELERTEPILAPEDQKRLGLAVDAESTITTDFGRFKPDRGEAWREDEFVVVQTNDEARRHKEATVRAFGRDSKFLGHRANFVIWDDLVDDQSVRSPVYRENLQRWWSDTAEKRVEPSGVFILQGQRLHSEDLYRFCIDQEVTDYDEDDDEPIGTRKVYRHIVYKAHYEDNCRHLHKPSDPPYDPRDPDNSGCLLDPRRLKYRRLMQERDKDRRSYTVVMQQEDSDPKTLLVRQEWITGGRDPETGEEWPGCWDDNRQVGQVPERLARPLISVVTADPSPTNFWSVQWWLYQPSSGQRWLLDHERTRMGANDLLDYNLTTKAYEGLLEGWITRARKANVPITWLIMERNAAQRFMTQYDFIRNWQRTRNCKIISHDTYGNKADPKLGIEATLPMIYRLGKVRLPGSRLDNVSRIKANFLVKEVTKYGETGTDDCAMAQWFLEYRIDQLRREAEVEQQGAPAFPVPSWLAKGGLRRVV